MHLMNLVHFQVPTLVHGEVVMWDSCAIMFQFWFVKSFDSKPPKDFYGEQLFCATWSAIFGQIKAFFLIFLLDIFDTEHKLAPRPSVQTHAQSLQLSRWHFLPGHLLCDRCKQIFTKNIDKSEKYFLLYLLDLFDTEHKLAPKDPKFRARFYKLMFYCRYKISSAQFFHLLGKKSI